MNKSVVLPSGAKLDITEAPFSVAKELYRAVLAELKTLKIEGKTEVDYNLLKDLFCTAFSSKAIDESLQACFKSVAYNSLRIDEKTWEPTEARGDYMDACLEVAQVNLAPFMKSLFAESNRILANLKNALK